MRRCRADPRCETACAGAGDASWERHRRLVAAVVCERGVAGALLDLADGHRAGVMTFSASRQVNRRMVLRLSSEPTTTCAGAFCTKPVLSSHAGQVGAAGACSAKAPCFCHKACLSRMATASLRHVEMRPSGRKDPAGQDRDRPAPTAGSM